MRKLKGSDGLLLDEALVLRFDGPASATGEDLVELHCHGGRAVVAAVLAALSTFAHCRLAEPGEFTRRALSAGRIDLTEAEGLADLLEAETEAQRRAAMGVAGGGLRRLIAGWRERVVGLSAQAEAAIDYVGDEDETAVDTGALVTAARKLADEWKAWLARPRSDVLRRGARVVLAGPPNSGKSSLLNALAGEERAIVADEAGTTRDVIEVPLAIGGVPIILVDTAGIRSTDQHVERIGVERALVQVDFADVVLWLGDEESRPTHPRVIPIHAQADVRPGPPPDRIAVSVVTGEGLTSLLHAVLRLVETVVPPEDQPALNQRHADLLKQAAGALEGGSRDLVIVAEQLRQARSLLDNITGRSGTEEMLDALFSRYCLGK